MIYGIGTDIVRISRIAVALERQGGRFAKKILGSEEFSVFEKRRSAHPQLGVRYLATRFATKEAFSKAMGVGMRSPVSWHGVQALNDESGKPYIYTDGLLLQFLRDESLSVQLSITDEAEYAVAFVIIERK